MNGTLATEDFKFSGDFKAASGAILANMCWGSGAPVRASVHIATNGSKPELRWKVIESLSVETSADLIRLKPVVVYAPNLGLSQSFQVKLTSSAFRGWPSDHTTFGRSLNVQFLRSGVT